MRTGTTVFVLSKDRQPLDPCHPARARRLLSAGRAAVYRRQPFTILLKDRSAAEAAVQGHRLKIDPGSRTTGLAVVAPAELGSEQTGKVVWAGEIAHRGQRIRDALLARRQLRRSRRSRKCRYRAPRFDNPAQLE